MFLVLIVVAGNETTRNALTGGLLAFSRFPDQKRRVIEDPSLWDTAVDEIIRYVSPVMSFSRTVTRDHTYKGVDLRSEEHTSELQSLMRISYAVFCLTKKKQNAQKNT